MERTKIVFDTKGGDNGAPSVLKGVAAALEKYPELDALLVGDEEIIEAECKNLGIDPSRVEILNAPDEITNYDSPAEALFKKPESSMVKALSALSAREDLFGLISSGNTGAILAGAMRFLATKDRVRPALAAVLPSEKGGFVCLVDTGATVDCTSQMLHHFARLGSAFMKETYAIENPKIGLLSNGSEPTKGNKLVKETHAILAADETLNFVGNFEGVNALSGDCDVLVADGFSGNQVLKVTEGTARRIITDLMKYAHKTGSDEVKRAAMYLMGSYDIGSLGGGNVLGVAKPVIKTRGSAGPEAFVNTAGMMLNISKNKTLFEK